MAAHEPPRRLHLNRAGAWLDFESRGLTLAGDGSLELAALPRVTLTPPDLGTLPEPDGPAGLAVSSDGTIYLTYPMADQLLRIGPCEEDPSLVPCVGIGGSEPTRLASPRAVVIDERRSRLVVADTGNDRLQLFDRETGQLVAIWGQPPGGGQLAAPTALAIDRDGFVYVIDHGNARVQKFSPAGALLPSFWARLRTEAEAEPVAIAANGAEATIEIWILDRHGRLLVVEPDGRQLYQLQLPNLERPLGFAVDRDAIYVGDNAQRRILKYDADGQYLGEAEGYEGPVAALALDRRGGLLAHPGEPPIVRLSQLGARSRRGFMWGGPFQNRSGRREQWHQVSLTLTGRSPEARVQLFLHSSATEAAPAVDEAAPVPFGSAWRPIPIDAPAAIVSGAPFDNVWIGIQFSSEGAESARLHDIQLDFDYRGCLGYLPAVLREDPVSRDFLVRFLGLMHTALESAEDQIDRLPALFDPMAAPRPWLPWLASWLAFDLDTNWPEEKGRAAIARAFEASGWRGTPHGIAETIAFLTGLQVRIVEPILDAGWWALAEEEAPETARRSSLLGYGTRLVAFEPQGAVLDTTAVLDGSNLVAAEDFGGAMFGDVAHQFLVQVYRGQAYSEDAVALVRRLVEREKPAHTRYEVCVVEPLMRLGVQARIGIDSIVAPVPQRDEPGGLHARIGQQLRVGAAVSA
jgi:phage tail-like protein